MSNTRDTGTAPAQHGDQSTGSGSVTAGASAGPSEQQIPGTPNPPVPWKAKYVRLNSDDNQRETKKLKIKYQYDQKPGDDCSFNLEPTPDKTGYFAVFRVDRSNPKDGSNVVERSPRAIPNEVREKLVRKEEKKVKQNMKNTYKVTININSSSHLELSQYFDALPPPKSSSSSSGEDEVLVQCGRTSTHSAPATN